MAAFSTPAAISSPRRSQERPSPSAHFAPFETAEPPRAPHTIRFSRGPLPLDVEGAAAWYAVRGELHPVWYFFVADTDRVHRYMVTVDHTSQAILRKQPLTFFQSPPPPRGLPLWLAEPCHSRPFFDFSACRP